MIDEKVVIQEVDKLLIALGTTAITDARKARDQLMDLRLMLMESIEIPDTIESIDIKGEIL